MKPISKRYSAIVLKRTNYGEADRILTLLTPEGKKRAMARGVRKEKSKLAGAIEPLVISDITLARGKGELETLTSARIDIFYKNILKDYDRLQFAYESMRLISKSSEMIDDPIWFSVLSEVLSSLDDFKIELSLIQTWFYLKYCALEGHELNLSIDSAGKPLTSGGRYWYDPTEKGLALADKGNIKAEQIKVMRLLSSKTPKIVAKVGGVDEVINDCLLVSKEHAAIY